MATETPALIDGKPVTSAETIEVRSPFDDRLISTVPKCETRDVDAAVAAAKRRLDGPPLPAYERAAILDRAAAALEGRTEEFARSISDEAGKPITAARTETTRAIDTLRFSAAAARTMRGEMVAMDASKAGSGRLGFTLRVPVGVAAGISPFNFPLNLVCHKIAPAVAAGAPMVLKPASATPLTALMIARLFEECGLPPGWLNVVTCPGSTAGHLVEHPDVAMITFTGSADVGWSIRESVPKKRVGLELGNSSPVIVEDDADLELAASRIVAGGFGYSGQTCISVQRVYGHRAIYDELIDRVDQLSGELGVGDPSDESTTVSSLITSSAAERVHQWIIEAVEAGAKMVRGEPERSPSTDEPPLNLVAPTLLRDISMQMKVSCDEAFGPVIGFSSYESLDDAIDAANGTRYGLQAGIFTSNIETALSVTSRLRFGGVIVNDTSSYRTDQMPYGGVKDSGNTREGPAYAVEEMTETRVVIIRG